MAGCAGCTQSAPSGPNATLQQSATQVSNPYAMPVTGPVAGPPPPGGCCGQCADKDSNLWRDIITALIISLVVGGLFFGKAR